MDKNKITFNFPSEIDKQNFLAWFMDCGGDQLLGNALNDQGKNDLYVSSHVGYRVGEEHEECVINMSVDND